jgi:hypothetical protein
MSANDFILAKSRHNKQAQRQNNNFRQYLRRVHNMGKNPPLGPGRKGEVKGRTQLQNPVTKLWVKRNDETGRFMDNKTSGGKFKGIRRE